MTQLRQKEDRFRESGVDVAIVTFDSSVLARMYVEQTELDWPVLIDTDRRLYRSYGMERAGGWAIYGPASVWNYLKLMARGRWPGRPGRDFRQLGGDVLIDPESIIRFHFVSDSPHDRPTVEQILAARAAQ